MNSSHSSKLRVAILGATGLVGRRFVELLLDHPWFQIELLVGDKSIGEDYGTVWKRKEDALRNHYGEHFWEVRNCPPAYQHRPVSSRLCLVRDPLRLRLRAGV